MLADPSRKWSLPSGSRLPSVTCCLTNSRRALQSLAPTQMAPLSLCPLLAPATHRQPNPASSPWPSVTNQRMNPEWGKKKRTSINFRFRWHGENRLCHTLCKKRIPASGPGIFTLYFDGSAPSTVCNPEMLPEPRWNTPELDPIFLLRRRVED